MKMPPVENQHSSLLSKEENFQIFKLLGNRCQTMATTVVQLYCTQVPHHSQWCKKDTGVLCFVKDHIRKNYFFRLFCLRRNILLWEHEMYNSMEYSESTSFLHTFEGEDCIVAFNFASPEEAKELKVIVDQRIYINKRREERRARQINQSQSLKLPATNDISAYKKSPNPEAKLAKRKRNITKADISTPMDFKHISHVGWNPNSGFDVDIQDEQLKTFFQKAGVSEKELQDKDTREFIYDFINQHGGAEAVANVGAPPAVPPRGPPKPPHARAAPPPPPVINNVSSAPRTQDVPSKKPAPPPVISGGFTPPAPPPPPPPMEMPIVNVTNGGQVPPPPPMSDNSALLESIRSGTSLKPVEERKPTPQEDARGDLLSEIRKGLKLKPVDEREIKPSSSPKQSGGNDLACALARALAERSKAIHSEDDADDSESSNDDEWGDD